MLATCIVEEEAGRVISLPLPKGDVCQFSKEKHTIRLFKMTTELGGYEMNGIMLDLDYEVNIFSRKSWEMMGKTNLFFSPIQIWLANK
jgi:hypothetical protein